VRVAVEDSRRCFWGGSSAEFVAFKTGRAMTEGEDTAPLEPSEPIPMDFCSPSLAAEEVNEKETGKGKICNLSSCPCPYRP
jgi:hypothetical protein